MTWECRGISVAGGLLGGIAFAAGLYVTRRHLRRPIHAVKDEYDPVHQVVVAIEHWRRKLGKA